MLLEHGLLNTRRPNTQSDKSRLDSFRTLASEISALAAQDGLTIKPWSHLSLPHFSRLAPMHQKAILDCLDALLIAGGQLILGKESIWNTCRLTWAVLKHMGYSPSADIIDHIEEDSYVAAYNVHQQMIFTSPNHFKLISYSLEDIYSRPWMDLFRRDEQIERILIPRAIAMAKGQYETTISNADVPSHEISETESFTKRSAVCRSKLYSPIYRHGQVGGFISVNGLTPVLTAVDGADTGNANDDIRPTFDSLTELQ